MSQSSDPCEPRCEGCVGDVCYRPAPRPRPRVYVAGVISADPVGGVRDAIDAFFALWDAGYAPFVPHLDLLLQLQRPLPWADWLEYDFRWVEVCDAVYRIPGQKTSPGADRECAHAEALGIPVARAGLEALKVLCPPADSRDRARSHE